MISALQYFACFYISGQYCDVLYISFFFYFYRILCFKILFCFSCEMEFKTQYMGFPGGSEVKNLPAVQVMQETRVQSLGQEEPLEEGMATHSSILPRESHGQRSQAGYCPQGFRESNTTEVTEHMLN